MTWWTLTRRSRQPQRPQPRSRWAKPLLQQLEERWTPDAKVFSDAGLTTLVGTYTGTSAIAQAVAAPSTLDGYFLQVDTATTNTYTPTTFTKSLTLRGPNAAISPNGGSRVPEVFIDTATTAFGLVDNVTVTVSGFTFTSTTGLTGQNAIVANKDGYAVTFSKNIVTNQNSNSQRIVTLSSGASIGFTAALVDDNKFFGNGVLNAAIGLRTGTNGVVSNNVVDGSFAGIQLAGSSTSGLINALVTNNTVLNSVNEGIQIANNVKSATVTLNTFTGTNTGGGNSGAVRVQPGLNAANVQLTVTKNLINGGNNGLVFAGGPLPAGANYFVNLNSIAAATGSPVVTATDANVDGVLNLSGNWFGTATPAAIPAKVTGGRPYVVQSYLSAGTNAAPGAGFEPAAGVEMRVPQTAATSGVSQVDGRIQTGIDRAVSGMTVRVAADTYREFVTAGKPVTLLGAQAGVSPVPTGTAARAGGETVIRPPSSDPAQGNLVRLAANGVTVDGFTLDGSNPALGASTATLNGVDLHARRGVSTGTDTGGWSNASSTTLANNVIVNLAGQGVLLYDPTTAAPTPNNSVAGNVIDNVTSYGVYQGYNSYAQIVGNRISRVDYGVFVFNNFNPLAAGPAPVVSNNTVTFGNGPSQSYGVWVNNNFGSASPVTIGNNTLTAAAGTRNSVGVLVTSEYPTAAVALANNAISNAESGYQFGGVDQQVSVTGGSVTGGRYGVVLLSRTGLSNGLVVSGTEYQTSFTQFGPAAPLGGLTAPLAAANLDGTAPSAGALTGKIAVVQRGGGFTFIQKVKNAQLAGAVGVVLVDNTAGSPNTISATGIDPTITIPSAFVRTNDGPALVNGASATLRPTPFSPNFVAFGPTGNVSGSTVTVSGLTVTNAAVAAFYAFDAPPLGNPATAPQRLVLSGVTASGGGAGVRVEGPNATADVTASSFSGNAVGLSVVAGGNLTAFTANTVANAGTALSFGATVGTLAPVTNNSITGSGTIANNAGATAVDAGGNWLGTVNAATIAGQLVGPVDVTPYLASGTDTSAAPGFQGGFGTLYVTAVGSQTGSKARVQEGVDSVTTGGTVRVTAGTYLGATVVNKPVALLGAQAGVSPIPTGTAARSGGESVLRPAASDPAQGNIVTLAANSVTVDGFTLDGSNAALGASTAVLNGVALHAYRGVSTGTDTGGWYNVGAATVTANVVVNLAGEGVQFYDSTTGAATALSSVTGNVIDNVADTAVYQGYNSYATVTGNKVSRVAVGVFVFNNFNPAPAGPAPAVSNNTITFGTGPSQSYGVWVNNNFGSAAPLAVSNNTLTAAAGTRNSVGVLVTSEYPAAAVALTNNAISNAESGYQFGGVDTQVSVTGGTVTGGRYGVTLVSRTGLTDGLVVSGTAYQTSFSQFGPAVPLAGVTAPLAAANLDGTAPSAGALAGKIAVVQRGSFPFVQKVKNAQLAGAVGVVIVDNQAGSPNTFAMTGIDPTITIPSAFVRTNDGPALVSGASATLRPTPFSPNFVAFGPTGNVSASTVTVTGLAVTNPAVAAFYVYDAPAFGNPPTATQFLQLDAVTATLSGGATGFKIEGPHAFGEAAHSTFTGGAVGIDVQAGGQLNDPLGTGIDYANYVQNAGVGLRLAAGTAAAGAFYLNSFTGNAVNVQNDSTTGFDASANYWGVTTEAGVAAKVTGTGAVDFTPYFASGADSDVDPLYPYANNPVTPGLPGFQPDATAGVYVTALGAQLGSFAGVSRIQEAIYTFGQLAVPTETGPNVPVYVYTGTYAGDVLLDYRVTLSPVSAASARGKVDIVGTLTATANPAQAGTVFLFDVEGTATPGVSFDQITATSIDLGTGVVTLQVVSNAYTAGFLDQIDVLDSPNAVSGTFTNGATVTAAPVGNTFVIQYNPAGSEVRLLSKSGTPTFVYVNDNWANQTVGADADGTGPLTNAFYGVNAFNTVQEGINTVTASGTVNVLGGNGANYAVAANVTKAGLLFQALADAKNAEADPVLSGAITLTNGAKFANGAGSNFTLSGAVGGAGALDLDAAAGTITLAGSGANTFAGGVTVRGGQLALNKPSGTAAVSSALTVGDGAAPAAVVKLLADEQIGNGVAVTLSSDGTLDVNGRTETVGGLAAAAATAQVALGANGTLAAGGDNLSTAFAGTVGGSGSLVKQGAGTLTLTNAANSFGGVLAVQGGAVKLGAAGVVPDAVAVSVASGATFDLNGFNETIASLAGPAGAAVTLGVGTLTTGAGGATVYGGSIAGSGGLVKQGAATFTFGGAGTFTGPVAVQAGTLALSGSLAAGAAVTLSGGTTLDGLTTGTITGRAVVVAGTKAAVTNLLSVSNPGGAAVSIGAGASAKVTNVGAAGNGTSGLQGTYGLLVNGGTAWVQGTVFRNDAVAGLAVQNGGTVDAGQGGGGFDFTGLNGGGLGQGSTGGNSFLGFDDPSKAAATKSNVPPAYAQAVLNLNTTGANAAAGPQGQPADVFAQGNTWTGYAGGSDYTAIERQVYHDVDSSARGFVNYVNAAGTFATLTGTRYYAVSTAESAAQRSLIRRVRLQFDNYVVVGGGAVGVTRLASSANGVTASTYTGAVATSLVGTGFDYATGAFTYDFGFTGSGTEASGSLEDGNYTLAVNGGAINAFSAGGPTLPTNFTANFFRLFGDVDGNRLVNDADKAVFTGTYGSTTASSNYLAYLNYNLDSSINATDQTQFTRRYNTFRTTPLV